ncbi:MAG: ABC transporter ATP-binding protein [Desulfobacterales bacterium]
MTDAEAPLEPIVCARNLTRIYPLGSGTVTGVEGVNLDIARGEFVVLKGPSGSGKSTLLALLAGLDAPSAGELTVAGRRLSGRPPGDLTRFRREAVGMVFQSFNLLPTLNVLENVCLPALLAGRDEREARRRAEELLERLGLSGRARHPADRLSGGEMQRVAIARAVINGPALVLADEPTGNLDSKNGTAVIELLARLNREDGVTVLLATHSDLADGVATRTLSIRDGALVSPPCGA